MKIKKQSYEILTWQGTNYQRILDVRKKLNIKRIIK